MKEIVVLFVDPTFKHFTSWLYL